MLNVLQNDDVGKLIIRLTTGVLILFHGVAKIAHPESLAWIEQLLRNHGLFSFIAYGVYVGEIVAALMIILGIYSRLGGLLIVINMIFAIVLAHADEIFSLGEHGQWAIEIQVFYLMSGFAIMLLGSGKYAVKPDLR